MQLSPSALRRSRPPRGAGRPSPAEAARLDNDLREAALRLFLDGGYEGTSMEAIAKSAGTTKRTVYTRFRSKEELFSSVLWWALQRSDWPQAEPDPESLDDLKGALWSIAQAAIKRALDPAMVKLSRIAATYSLHYPDFAQRTLQAGVSSRYNLIIELLKRHAAKGTIQAGDPEILAEHFLAMVSGAPARLALFNIVRDVKEQHRRLRVAVDLFVRGLRPD